MMLTKRIISTIESKRVKTRLWNCSRVWSQTMSASLSHPISRSRKIEQLLCSKKITLTSFSILTRMDQATAHQQPLTRVRPSSETMHQYPHPQLTQHHKRQKFFASPFSSLMSTWALRDLRGSSYATVTPRRHSLTNSVPSMASKTPPCSNN